MLARLSACAALAVCVAVAITPVQAEPPAETLIRRVYQVADLVVPISPPNKVVGSEPAKMGEARQSLPMQEDRLIERIVKTIQPASWSQHHGAGTIDYFPLAGSLVINQTPAVHNQVAELLTTLRKEQDTQVSLEIRIVTMPEEMVKKLPIAASAQEMEPTFLKDEQLKEFLNSAAADACTQIMTSPKMTLLTGQTGVAKIKEEGRTGLSLKALPVVSADRQYVQLTFRFDQSEQSALDEFASQSLLTKVVIPDGNTAILGCFKKTEIIEHDCCMPAVSRIPYLNRLFKNVAYSQEAMRQYVLVTPRIVVAEVEEQRPLVVATPAIQQTSGVESEPMPLTLPTGHYLDHLPQYTPPMPLYPLPLALANQPTSAANTAPCCAEDKPFVKEGAVVAELLRAYDKACADGKLAEAKKLARAALIIDPTCFSKKR